MNKKVKYTVYGTIIGALVNGGKNTFNQFENRSENPDWEFDWKELGLKLLTGAAIGGAGGLAIGAIVDNHYANSSPIDTDKLLTTTIATVAHSSKNKDFQLLNRKKERLVHFLKNYFGEDIHEPLLIGSTVKGTALKDKSDIDISVTFKHKRIQILNMVQTVYAALNNEFSDNDLIKVRKQHKSVGVLFELNGKEVKIDIVPGHKTNNDINDHSVTLHKKGNWLTPDSRTKTNFRKLANPGFSKVQMDLCVLLKNFAQKHDVPLRSHHIEQYVLAFYKANKGSLTNNKLTNKALSTFRHIYKTIDQQRLISPENTSNNLNDISEGDKAKIKRKIKKVLDDYDYHPNTLVDWFG